MAYMVIGVAGLGFLLTGLSERRPKRDDATDAYLRQTMDGRSAEGRARLMGRLAGASEDRLRYALVKIVAGAAMLGLIALLLLLGIH